MIFSIQRCASLKVIAGVVVSFLISSWLVSVFSERMWIIFTEDVIRNPREFIVFFQINVVLLGLVFCGIVFVSIYGYGLLRMRNQVLARVLIVCYASLFISLVQVYVWKYSMQRDLGLEVVVPIVVSSSLFALWKFILLRD